MFVWKKESLSLWEKIKDMRKIVLGCLMLLAIGQVSAEKTYKYRVSLKDKVGTAYSIDKPEEFLSERALARRSRQQLPVDETDLPVSQAYVKEFQGMGMKLVTSSKWNNTVVLEVEDTLLVDKVKEMPFVTKVKKVWTQPDSIPSRNKKRKKEVTNEVKETGQYYGKAFRQINIHGGDSLHAAGFTGKGMHVAVIDAGFYNADKIKFFKKMDLLGTRDFFGKGFHECLLDVFVYQYVIRSYACLAAVKGLAPGYSFRCNADVCSLVYDAWTFTAKFKDHRGQISGCRCHDSLCQSRTSCKEYQIPSLFKQSCIDISISLNHSYISFVEGLGNHGFDDFGHIRHIWRRLQYCCTSGGNSSYQWVQKQLDRVVPWGYYQRVSQWLLDYVAS